MRFIPACAGNRIAAYIEDVRHTVHPRVCGEQSTRLGKAPKRDGSSPRVRGTENVDGSKFRMLRFIPACAGNRPQTASPSRLSPVHPRVCGEQDCYSERNNQIDGSSPRVRGTAERPTQLGLYGRFIPACAGNSGVSRYPVAPPPVHPRVCGEQQAKSGISPYTLGSSPRVRGTESHQQRSLAIWRFIPACAGNSS